jgi:hypothetical protein
MLNKIIIKLGIKYEFDKDVLFDTQINIRTQKCYLFF